MGSLVQMLWIKFTFVKHAFDKFTGISEMDTMDTEFLT